MTVEIILAPEGLRLRFPVSASADEKRKILAELESCAEITAL